MLNISIFFSNFHNPLKLKTKHFDTIFIEKFIKIQLKLINNLKFIPKDAKKIES